jgi:3-oxoacyl-[acyl-carrier-protein] synthase II
MSERVAVTGVGIVSALGLDAASTFAALLAGKRGFAPLTLFDPADARARIAAEVRGLDPTALGPTAGLADFSRTDVMAVAAAREAMAAAGWPAGRRGVSLGGTTGGMLESEQALLSAPPGRFEPERAKRLLSDPLDRTTRRVADAVGGAVRCATLCAACSSSALALLRGVAWLRNGETDVVLAGGADGLCRLTFFGFDALGALDPEPCRPFDAGRRGLGLGEGAGFLCLERESSARARGAEILALLTGVATGAEAHHITHPEPTGRAAAELLRRALGAAGLSAADLDYVNAHGTGTQANDATEARALHAALGPEASRVLVSSIKGQLGHTLGAAGAIEAAVTVLSIQRGAVPATAGLVEPEDGALAHVIGGPVERSLRAAASCSFGFGGTGAVLVFERAHAPRRHRAEPAPPRIVVTGLAAIGPFGSLVAAEASRLLDAPAVSTSAPIAPPVLSDLDPERSRRFDPTSALVTRLAALACADAKLDGTGTGISAGTAFGSVERSVRFVLRAVERGVRRASPAEFPQLVASAASGNASIYLRLTGAAFGVAGGAAAAEGALCAARVWLEAGQGRAFVAGAAVELDPIVAAVLADPGGPPRTEGGGFLVLELLESAENRGAMQVALLEGPWEHAPGERLAAPPPRDPGRALVLSGELDAEQRGLLELAGWGTCPRRSTLAQTGFHEAASGAMLAVAASVVHGGQSDEVLTLSRAGDAIWCALFRRAERAP